MSASRRLRRALKVCYLKQDLRLSIIGLVTVISLNYADALTTVFAVRTGIGIELNPLVANAMLPMLLLKVTIVPALVYVFYFTLKRLKKQHHETTFKMGFAATIVMIAMYAFVVTNNIVAILRVI